MNCSVSYLSELENGKKDASESFIYHLSHKLISSPEYILTGKEPVDLTYEEIYDMIIKHGEVRHIRLFHDMLLTLLVFHSQKIEDAEATLKSLVEKNKNTPSSVLEKEIGLVGEVIDKSRKTMSIVGPILRKIPL